MIHGSDKRVAIVTGASAGIGRQVALRLGTQGWRVGLIARRANLLEEVAREISAVGGEPLVLPADVSQRLQVEAAIGELRRRWNRTDVLINNAGFGVHGFMQDCFPEDFERIMAVNYLGAVYCTRAVLPIMISQMSGCIVNVGSISGRVPGPGTALYSASKAALEAFSCALRMELGGTGVSVALVILGGTKSDFFKAMVRRRPVDEEEIARALKRYMPTRRAADAIVRVANKPRPQVFVPLWLSPFAACFAVFPSLVEKWLLKPRWSK